MDLTWRESSSIMKPCLLEVSLEEEYHNLVWPYLKDLDGMSQTTPMLSLITLVKDKDAHSSLEHAPPTPLNLLNIAQELTEDVPQLEEEVMAAKVILLVKAVNSIALMKNMIVRMIKLLIMLPILNYKPSEEAQAVNVSLVPSLH